MIRALYWSRSRAHAVGRGGPRTRIWKPAGEHSEAPSLELLQVSGTSLGFCEFQSAAATLSAGWPIQSPATPLAPPLLHTCLTVTAGERHQLSPSEKEKQVNKIIGWLDEQSLCSSPPTWASTSVSSCSLIKETVFSCGHEKETIYF